MRTPPYPFFPSISLETRFVPFPLQTNHSVYGVDRESEVLPTPMVGSPSACLLAYCRNWWLPVLETGIGLGTSGVLRRGTVHDVDFRYNGGAEKGDKDADDGDA